MKLDNVFKKTRAIAGRIHQNTETPQVPEGLLRKCNMCGKAIIAEEAVAGGYICPRCGGYFRVSAVKRLAMVLDEGSFQEWDSELEAGNPMGYKGYEDKLELLREKTGLREAVITGEGTINGMRTVIGVCDGRFMMASMGWAVGEKITRAVERAVRERLPIIMFICSGGARMQEGMTSLMQMAKTSAALKKHSDAGLLYISVLTDPTTGGVTASFAMLGDIILAEPGALIGFAGPRVIEQTIKERLPKGFQCSEFLLEHGFIDAVVERKDYREVLGKLLKLHKDHPGEYHIRRSENNSAEKTERKKSNASAWDRVMRSRRMERPSGSEYIKKLFEDFFELHGDRYYGDDKAVMGGIAYFNNIPVTVIAQVKGSSTSENISRNFGMPSPEGYRKALRLMKEAEKFNRPVICFVDTPGAFCGIGAEERGQGESIARNLYEMSGLRVPVLSVVIGEGGSGGALALAVADEVWMLENSVYSILSPEGFATILWRDSSKAEEAAGVMKLTAEDLLKAGFIEKVIDEPEDLSAGNIDFVTEKLSEDIEEFLKKYMMMDREVLVGHRYSRFRKL